MPLLTKSFDGAQVFYVDPAVVNDAPTCDISAVNLYFKFKPDFNLNLTNSRPGVVVYIVPTRYGVPLITRDSGVFTLEQAELSYSDITTSSDATVPSTFRFPRPITVETGKEYAILWSYDLSSQYVIWKSKVGEVLTGSTLISPGPSNKIVGKYYTFNTVFQATDDSNLDEYLKNWRPVSDTTIKFDIKIARYSHGGIPVSGNSSIDSSTIIKPRENSSVTANNTSSNAGFNINFNSYEYILYDFDRSTEGQFIGAQQAYQNTVFYPGGWSNSNSYLTITTTSGNNVIVANTLLPNGATFQWSNIFSTIDENSKIVVTDETTTNIRGIAAIESNTRLVLTEEVSFSSSNAKVMITPTGRCSQFDRTSPFGISSSFLMLVDSSANSTVRFVNNTITAVTVTNGGSGYNNSDVFYVKGFENVPGVVTGGYVAVANLVTNSTGSITALHFSNLGCGFVNSASIEAVVANSSQVGNTTSNTSAGSSATFTYTVGADLRTEYGSNIFRDCTVRNLELGEFVPFFTIDDTEDNDYNLKLETNYYKTPDSNVIANEAFYVNDRGTTNQLDIVMYDVNYVDYLDKIPAIMSKSNEFNTLYANGNPNDKVSNTSTLTSESFKLTVDVDYSNSDFSTIRFWEPKILFTKHIINNDYTDEHTDSGNAYAKGITKTFNFARTAEDLRLFLTAYRPANTDVRAYARIFKNEDPDAFDDKNWTELEVKAGNNLFSSTSDLDDFIEMEFGFFQVPQTRTALDGSVQIQSGNATVVGSGTTFSTDLAVGDLVYMYQPLFVNNHLVVSVASITNNTEFVMDTTTANVSLITEGMNIEKITYPRQAFNNKQNDNIVRYYNSAYSKFDGYESIAIKIVMLSSNPHIIPRIDDMRGVGLSA